MPQNAGYAPGGRGGVGTDGPRPWVADPEAVSGPARWKLSRCRNPQSNESAVMTSSSRFAKRL